MFDGVTINIILGIIIDSQKSVVGEKDPLTKPLKIVVIISFADKS